MARPWSPRQSVSALVSTAVLVLGVLGGCGTDQAAPGTPSRPTLGSSEAPAEAGDGTATTGTTLAPKGPIGPPLPAGAPAADILAAVNDAHGPTVDASAQMNRFAPFPSLATPDGAEIVELRADSRTTTDGTAANLVAEVALAVAVPPEDLVAFYTDELTGTGWTATDDTTTARSRRLTFDQPDASYPLDDLVVTIETPPPDGNGSAGGGRTVVRLHHTTQVPADDTTVLDRLAGWAADLPLPEGGEVTGAGIQSTNEGRASLHWSLTVDYGAADPAQLADGVRAGLPTPTFAIDPRPATGDALDNWVYLTSPVFAEARVSPHAAAGGITLLNVTARAGLDPA